MKLTYCGTDRSGNPVSGQIEASGPAEATETLHSEDIQVTNLKPVSTFADKLMLRGVSAADMASFCDQLARLIEADMPLPEALSAMAHDASQPSFRDSLFRISQGLEEGEALDTLLEREKNIFPDLLPALVLAGQESGSLSETLRLAATHSWRMAHLKQQIWASLAYPGLILVILFVITIGIFTQIVPVYDAMISNMGVYTSEGTRYIFWVSQNPYTIFGGITGICLLLWLLNRIAKQVPPLRRIRQAFWFHLPFYGRVLKSSFLACFCRTLSLFLKSGIPLHRAVKLMSVLDRKSNLQSDSKLLTSSVENGHSLSAALNLQRHLYPDILICMVKYGERTGQLSEALMEAAELNEMQAKREVSIIHSILPPILLISVGILFMFVIRQMLLPLIEIMNNIG